MNDLYRKCRERLLANATLWTCTNPKEIPTMPSISLTDVMQNTSTAKNFLETAEKRARELSGIYCNPTTARQQKRAVTSDQMDEVASLISGAIAHIEQVIDERRAAVNHAYDQGKQNGATPPPTMAEACLILASGNVSEVGRIARGLTQNLAALGDVPDQPNGYQYRFVDGSSLLITSTPVALPAPSQPTKPVKE